MIQTIIKYPDERLRQVSKPTDDWGVIAQLAPDLIETMLANRGIGLAAVQIGVPVTVLVVDMGVQYTDNENGWETKNSQPQVFINPVILKAEGTVQFTEGCLSVPGIYEMVKRHKIIELEWFDLQGKKVARRIGEDGEQLLSICVQHEMDHFSGKLFIDKLSLIKKEMLRKKLRAL